ncbi:MAG: protein kinase [Sandaracinaceae bacterium]
MGTSRGLARRPDAREREPDPLSVQICCHASPRRPRAGSRRRTARVARRRPLDLVHRDVSPHNILIGFDGVVRVADFGIARAIGRERTSTGVLRASSATWRPRSPTPEPRRADDLFSLGVVLLRAAVRATPLRRQGRRRARPPDPPRRLGHRAAHGRPRRADAPCPPSPRTPDRPTDGGGRRATRRAVEADAPRAPTRSRSSCAAGSRKRQEERKRAIQAAVDALDAGPLDAPKATPKPARPAPRVPLARAAVLLGHPRRPGRDHVAQLHRAGRARGRDAHRRGRTGHHDQTAPRRGGAGLDRRAHHAARAWIEVDGEGADPEPGDACASCTARRLARFG